jgi:Bacterial PH domain
MPQDQVREYRPDSQFYVTRLAIASAFFLLGLVTVVHFGEGNWRVLALGVLLMVMATLMVAAAVTTRLTVHEQGVVVRQSLRRKFIPWPFIRSIECGTGRSSCRVVISMYDGTSMYDGARSVGFGHAIDGAAGSRDHVEKIIAVMRDFQRRANQESLAFTEGPPRAHVGRSTRKPARKRSLRRRARRS